MHTGADLGADWGLNISHIQRGTCWPGALESRGCSSGAGAVKGPESRKAATWQIRTSWPPTRCDHG